MTLNHTKAGPPSWIWDQARRLFQRMRGDRIDRIVEPTPIVRDRMLAQFERDNYVGKQVEKLFANEITIQQWQTDLRVSLKLVYIDEYMVARGGREAMTAADWQNLDRMLKKQYSYMDQFAADIASGKLSDKQIAARMKMYFNSARQANEVGRAAARGLPALPAYPGDGQTVCRSNCQCHWDIHETDTEWLCTWTLGIAEHCPDCVANSERWAPLRIPK